MILKFLKNKLKTQFFVFCFGTGWYVGIFCYIYIPSFSDWISLPNNHPSVSLKYLEQGFTQLGKREM